MKDISDATDLMATAREALLQEILPALPREQRYAGLMVANVLAIAAREIQAGRDAADGESSRLFELLEGASASARGLPPLRRALAQAIRTGRFDDGERRAACAAHLARTAADWVAISNPKALRKEAS